MLERLERSHLLVRIRLPLRLRVWDEDGGGGLQPHDINAPRQGHEAIGIYRVCGKQGEGNFGFIFLLWKMNCFDCSCDFYPTAVVLPLRQLLC